MKTAMRFIFATLLLASSAAAHASSPAVDTVTRLYQDFAWEVVLVEPQATALPQLPREEMLKYVTPELASALLADAECVATSGELCALDFAPLWAAQDPSAQYLTVTQGGRPDQVLVEFTLPSTQDKVSLQFHVVPTKAGWRVADIAYPDAPSLAKVLEDASE